MVSSAGNGFDLTEDTQNSVNPLGGCLKLLVTKGSSQCLIWLLVIQNGRGCAHPNGRQLLKDGNNQSINQSNWSITICHCWMLLEVAGTDGPASVQELLVEDIPWCWTWQRVYPLQWKAPVQ
jgi:hypothetical protein